MSVKDVFAFYVIGKEGCAMGFQSKVLPYAYEIKTIDSHTMGESTRIVYDGFPYLPGDTMMEKRNILWKIMIFSVLH